MLWSFYHTWAVRSFFIGFQLKEIRYTFINFYFDGIYFNICEKVWVYFIESPQSFCFALKKNYKHIKSSRKQYHEHLCTCLQIYQVLNFYFLALVFRVIKHYLYSWGTRILLPDPILFPHVTVATLLIPACFGIYVFKLLAHKCLCLKLVFIFPLFHSLC